MKIKFESCNELLDGIELIKDELNIEIVKDEASLTVKATAVSEEISSVKLANGIAEITYGGAASPFNGKSRFFRALAKTVDAVKNGKTELNYTENPIFNNDGAMIDMSRNAVMKVSTVEDMLRKLALMGMNTYMLYTEDTYTLDNRPYFGYMRGRYSHGEIRELDVYAIKLGIELIPCIQVLGHLSTYLRWDCTAPYKDTAQNLLPNTDETYELIGEMLDTLLSDFTTRRVHLGMDETHVLGTGRYLDKFGYVQRKDIYLAHLKRVAEMTEARGLKPMIWSDMFFRLAANGMAGFTDYDPRVELPEDIIALVPKNIQPVFWDYYHADEGFYEHGAIEHKKFAQPTVFAGGVWCWANYSMLLTRTIENTVPALRVCKRQGIREMLATCWHNGSEAPLYASLVGIAIYADFDYTGEYDKDSVSSLLKLTLGRTLDDFFTAEKVDYPCGFVGSTRALMANDPLIGLLDVNVGELIRRGYSPQDYYSKVAAEIEAASNNGDAFDVAFKTLGALARVLERKTDFGIRLKKAYDEKDVAMLKALSEECDEIISRISTLRSLHRNMWMYYNKPFGWEIFDIRYGTALMRFETTKSRICDYICGKIDSIGELEEERLSIDCREIDKENPFGPYAMWFHFTSVSTTGII